MSMINTEAPTHTNSLFSVAVMYLQSGVLIQKLLTPSLCCSCFLCRIVSVLTGGVCFASCARLGFGLTGISGVTPKAVKKSVFRLMFSSRCCSKIDLSPLGDLWPLQSCEHRFGHVF